MSSSQWAPDLFCQMMECIRIFVREYSLHCLACAAGEILNPMCSFYHKYMLACRKSFCFPRWYFVIKQQLVDSALNSNYLHRKFWWYHSASLWLTLFGIIFCAETRVDIKPHWIPPTLFLFSSVTLRGPLLYLRNQ